MLALFGGGMVRAEMLFAAAACHDTSPAHAGHHHAPQPQNQDTSLPCCIDCLGCATFASSGQDPDLLATPVIMVSPVRYPDQARNHAGRTLRPEPGPPRTGA